MNYDTLSEDQLILVAQLFDIFGMPYPLALRERLCPDCRWNFILDD